MARTARIKTTGVGVSYYHVMSRANDRRLLFERGGVRTRLVDALAKAAAFSGVTLVAYVAMGNHFHAVCRVERTGEKVGEETLLARVAALKGEARAGEVAARWKELRLRGAEKAVEAEQDALRARMNDVSAFVKTFKETFDVAFKRERPYSGSIWNGRFKSTLVEDGKYLSDCIRYVEHNPIRAGLARRVRDYAWCSCHEDAPAGTVPEWLGRKVAQIGSGKVFGSEAYVRRMSGELGDRFGVRRVVARAVGEIGYATHGHRLAASA